MNEIHEILARAAALNKLAVSLTLHDIPAETAVEWVKDGLLDSIEPGAGNNPPTGRMKRTLNTDPRRVVEIVVFTAR